MIVRVLVLALVAGSLGLSACGRKSQPERPPAPQSAPSVPDPAPAPAPQPPAP